MEDWLRAQLANGFAAFQGASLSGSIPVKEELINQLIAGFLKQARVPPATEPAFDPRLVVPFVKKATIHADAGVVTLHLDLAIDSRT
jgi:hypothetical protein